MKCVLLNGLTWHSDIVAQNCCQNMKQEYRSPNKSINKKKEKIASLEDKATSESMAVNED